MDINTFAAQKVLSNYHDILNGELKAVCTEIPANLVQKLINTSGQTKPKERRNLKGSIFIMGKASEELPREFVNIRHF